MNELIELELLSFRPQPQESMGDAGQVATASFESRNWRSLIASAVQSAQRPISEVSSRLDAARTGALIANASLPMSSFSSFARIAWLPRLRYQAACVSGVNWGHLEVSKLFGSTCSRFASSQ